MILIFLHCSYVTMFSHINYTTAFSQLMLTDFHFTKLTSMLTTSQPFAINTIKRLSIIKTGQIVRV